MTLIKVPELPNGYTPRGRRRAFVRAYVKDLHKEECESCQICKNEKRHLLCEDYTRYMKFLEAWIEYQEDCEAHG